MDIQTALRQWSASTLDKAHRELGLEAADRIDVLEKSLKLALDVIEDVDTYSQASSHPAFGVITLAIDEAEWMKQQFSGECDWCRQESNDLVEHQDFEEGLAGQAWDVCGECRRKENEALTRELEGEE